MATDAFGRLRTSDVYTLFEYYPSAYTGVNLDNDMWINNTAGAGSTITYNTNTYVAMKVNASSRSAWRRSKAVIDYQPGKSREFLLSCTPLSRSIGGGEEVRVRIGVYLPNTSTGLPIEGMYLVVDQLGIGFAEAKGGSETITYQNNWNIDNFDGMGPSGINLTVSNMLNCTLIVFDQEWLGVGRIRCGFNINGITYYAHQYTHSSIQTPYTTTPRLPITYGITGTTVTGGDIATHQISCTAMSEGGFTPLGRRNNISTTFSGVDPTSGNVSYMVMGIRLQTSGGNCIYPTGILKLQNMDCLLYTSSTSSNAAGLHATFEIQIHNSLTGIGSVANVGTFTRLPNSISEWVQGDGNLATLVSSGYPIARFNLTQRAAFDFSQSEYETLLTRNQVYEGDTLYVIGVVNTIANLDPRFMCSIDVIEST